MAYVSIDIDPWEVIDDIDDEELVEYMRANGWYVSSQPDQPLIFSEIQFIMDLLDEKDWQQKRIYEKLLIMREESCH